MSDTQNEDDGNTFKSGPDILIPRQTIPTPRTDAMINEARRLATYGELIEFIYNHSRTLERELATEHTKLQEERTTSDFLASAIEGTTPPEQAIARYNNSLAEGVRGIVATTVFQKLTAEREAREMVEEALREIEMECGNTDPSDGEGTLPTEVVQSVTGLKQRVEQAEARLSDAINLVQYLRLLGSDSKSTLDKCDAFLSSTEPPALLK